MCVSSRPLHEDAGLHGVNDAAEARLLLGAPQHQPHLASEGGGQPITHLRRHRVRLDVTQLILGVHQAPGGWGRGEWIMFGWRTDKGNGEEIKGVEGQRDGVR